MIGFLFSKFDKSKDGTSLFEQLLKLFLEILLHTSGDVDEAFDWMKILDEQHQLTTAEYTLDDFRKDLEKNGYLDLKPDGKGLPTVKAERAMKSNALEEIFGKLKRGGSGQHNSRFQGRGDEQGGGIRDYQFGDKMEHISITDSFRNAQRNNGIEEFKLTENDLQVYDTEAQTQTATVVMIDISHSMILYGEDRITPAKKVAIALSEYIKRKYPKDFIDVLVFGNDAWQIELEQLPYLQVGPYHTNTVAGLELAMDLLRRRKVPNKQIFMITDGKPTCLKIDGEYYKNSSYGHDPKIISKCINLAVQCRKLHIPITTFMIASDPFLQSFVESFTEANNGKAFFSSLQGLGEVVFADFEKNRKKRF